MITFGRKEEISDLGQASYQKCPIVHPGLLLKYLPEFAPLAPLILNMIKVASSIFTWKGNPWDRGLAKSDPNVIAVQCICISHTTTTKIDTRRAIGIFGKHYDRDL